MIIKRVLFIEDGNITQQVDKLRSVLQKQGITLNEEIFDISQQKYRKTDPADQNKSILDFDIVKDDLRSRYMDQKFDYILCDFDFADPQLDGFVLTRWLKNVSESEKKRLRLAKFSLYSSEPDKFLKKHLSQDDISNLIRLRLNDFYSRTRISEDFGSSVVRSVNDIDIKDKLLDELEKYKDYNFRSVYPKFSGKTIGEIAEEIEKDTHHGRLFQDHFIELTVAHLIELNS